MPIQEDAQASLIAVDGLDPDVAAGLNGLDNAATRSDLWDSVRKAQSCGDWIIERGSLRGLSELGDEAATARLIWRSIQVFFQRISSRRQTVQYGDPGLTKAVGGFQETVLHLCIEMRSRTDRVWTLISKYRSEGNWVKERHLLNLLAFQGNGRAKRQLALRDFQHNLRRYSLSPYAIFRRKLDRARVTDAYYDVGPNGIDGFFRSTVTEAVESHRNMWRAFACVGLFLALADFHEQYVLDKLAFIPLLLGLFFIWQRYRHSGAAKAYEEAWKEIESRGLEWHFENGHYFRYLFIRNDGSYRIDPTLRERRIEQEISGVRNRADELHRAKFDTLIVAAVSVACAGGVYLACQYFGWTSHAKDFGALVGVVLAWASAMEPLSKWRKISLEQKAYDSGCKFIYGAHVNDPISAPVTKETVEAQNTLGDAHFAKPRDASAGLAG